MGRILPAHNLKERILEVGGHRPWRAASNAPAVDLADRRELRGGAGEKDLVRHIERIAGESLFDHGHVPFARELHHRVPGDPLQDGGERGCLDLALADDEDILPGTLRH